MKKAQTQFRFGVVFLVLALVSLIFSVGLVVFNQYGTGMNFGIVYTAFALLMFAVLGIFFTLTGWSRMRYLKNKQLKP